MGPIEKELRSITDNWQEWSCEWPVRISDETLDFTIRAAGSMGPKIRHEFLNGRTADKEVLSEAIEAAETLGL